MKIYLQRHEMRQLIATGSTYSQDENGNTVYIADQGWLEDAANDIERKP